MAFLAAGLVKGAQHVRREAKKNRARNAIISADGQPSSGAGSNIDSLSIEQDWWGGDGGSYQPSLLPEDKQQEEPTIHSSQQKIPEEIPLPLPPVVPSIDNLPPPSPTTLRRRPPKARQKSRSTSAAVSGSFLAQLEESAEEEKTVSKPSSVSSDASSSSRCIRQEAMFGTDPSKKAPRRNPQEEETKRGGGAKGAAPGSFTAAVLNRSGVKAPPFAPSTQSPMLHRARTAPVRSTGTYAQAIAGSQENNDNGSGRRGVPSRRKSSITEVKRGTFLEATKSDSKWDEFISKVDNDHKGGGSLRK